MKLKTHHNIPVVDIIHCYSLKEHIPNEGMPANL